MKVALRSDKYNRLGFVERYSQYFYDYKRISILGIADMSNCCFAEPYVLRGDEFIPASQIEEELGISKYIKAKKPFYSVIGTGNIIVSAKVAMSLGDTPIYIPEKSIYSLYYLNKDSLKSQGNGRWVADMKRISQTNDSIMEIVHNMGKEFVKCGGDRELFLKSRFE